MPLFPDKKRKLYNEENLPNKRQAVENEQEKENDDDWADDELNNILTQAENLNRIDDLVASSQMQQANSRVDNRCGTSRNVDDRLRPISNFNPERASVNTTARFENVTTGLETSLCQVACPSSYVVTPKDDDKALKELKNQMEILKQQMYNKDGQVKFLTSSNTKLHREMAEQSKEMENSLKKQADSFDRERKNLQSQIKSLQTQLEFTHHETNKPSFNPSGAPRTSRLQTLTTSSPSTSLYNRTRSFNEQTPASAPAAKRPTSGLVGLPSRHVQTTNESSQTGTDDGCHKKSWKLQGKGPRFGVNYADGVMDTQMSLRHHANHLEFGKTGCKHNQQVCIVKSKLKQRDYLRNPTGERVYSMYNDLISKKTSCTGSELLHRSRLFPPSDINPGLLPFVREAADDLKCYSTILSKRAEQKVTGIPLPPTMKRKHKIHLAMQKPVSPVADVLATVHHVVSACLAVEMRALHEVPFFTELVSTLSDLANKESVEDQYEVVMMSLEVLNLLLKRTEPQNMKSYSILLDDSGFIVRILQNDFNFDMSVEVKDLNGTLVLDLLTSLCALPVFKLNTCKEICQECILSQLCEFMSHFRLRGKSIFPSLHIKYQSLVRKLLPLRFEVKQECESPSCLCVTKTFDEVLLGLDELVDQSRESCSQFALEVIRGGMSCLFFIVTRFPWTASARNGMFFYIISSLQRFFKKYDDSLTKGSDS